MSDSGTGFADPAVGASEFNAQNFQNFNQLIRLSTVRWVKIVKVTSAGEPKGTTFVDVLPLVRMVNGAGQVTSHKPIVGVPFFRLSAGKNAIIMDPIVGEIGLMLCADRDSSVVKETKKESNPGSLRFMDLADGVYLGGILTQDPEQYVTFTTVGMEWADKNGNTIISNSDGVTINGVKFDRSQNITNIAEATSKTSVTLTQHKHHQANDSHGDTEPDVSTPFG